MLFISQIYISIKFTNYLQFRYLGSNFVLTTLQAQNNYKSLNFNLDQRKLTEISYMRKFFVASIANRKNIIELKYCQNNDKFTFLQFTNPSEHSRELFLTPSQINFCRKHQKYLTNFQEMNMYSFTKNDLQGKDLLNVDLKSLNGWQINKRKKQISYRNWVSGKVILMSFSLQFQIFKKQLQQNLTGHNLVNSLKLAARYNILDITFWQKAIALISHHYKKSPLEDRLFFNTIFAEYSYKFKPSFVTYMSHPFKFMLPENYLNDLCYFRSFLRATEFEDDYIKENDTDKQYLMKIQIFQKRIICILKVGKTVDMNKYWLKKVYAKRTSEIIQIFRKNQSQSQNFEILRSISRIYSFINFEDEIFFKKLDSYLIPLIEDKMQQKQLGIFKENASQTVNGMLSIWKITRNPNLKIYEAHFKPWIERELMNLTNLKFYSQLGVNLLGSGIRDLPIITKLLEASIDHNFSSDLFSHLLIHCCNAILNEKKYHGEFYECSLEQHPSIIDFFARNKKKVFSSCLQRTNHQNAREFKKKRLSEKNKNSQIHLTEFWWLQVIGQACRQLPQFQILNNARFCIYEIDALVITSTSMIAIEIQGSHYQQKESDNFKKKGKYTGKKEMKREILEKYGIDSVKISCESPEIMDIMQNNDKEKARKYVLRVIKQKVQEQTKTQSQLSSEN